MSDDLDIPEFLKISAERRKQGWANYKSQTVASRVDDHGPGSVCRRAGIPDGIASGIRERVDLLTAAKKCEGDAKHYAWIERVTTEKAAADAIKAEAVRVHQEHIEAVKVSARAARRRYNETVRAIPYSQAHPHSKIARGRRRKKR